MKEPDIRVGKTCVQVMKRHIDERTKKEKIIKLHEGIVVQNFGPFVRVFNPVSPDRGGDLSPEMSQCFPLQSKCIWCEIISQRETAIPIPPLLRY